MTPAQQDFVDLCRELLSMGVTTVRHGDFEATFRPMPVKPAEKRAAAEPDPYERFSGRQGR